MHFCLLKDTVSFELNSSTGDYIYVIFLATVQYANAFLQGFRFNFLTSQSNLQFWDFLLIWRQELKKSELD